jgi:hypothetical protein
MGDDCFYQAENVRELELALVSGLSFFSMERMLRGKNAVHGNDIRISLFLK